MTDVANPALRTMLEKQQKVFEVVEKLELKTIYSVRFARRHFEIQGEYNEISKLPGVELKETLTHLYADLVYEGVAIASCEQKED